jgi:hypothetical protein
MIGAEAVSHWLLTMKAHVQSEANSVEFEVDKAELGQVCLRVLWFTLVISIISSVFHPALFK